MFSSAYEAEFSVCPRRTFMILIKFDTIQMLGMRSFLANNFAIHNWNELIFLQSPNLLKAFICLIII